MKSKKFIIFILCIALALCAAVLLSSCIRGGNDECHHADGDGNGRCDMCGLALGTEPVGELKLVENGVPTFRFVFSVNATAAAKNIASAAFKDINKTLRTEAKIVYENDGKENDVEIILAPPRYRGDDYAIDPHYLGPEGYAIKLIGKKILILYGSEAMAEVAINHVKTVLFGITSTTKSIDNLAVSADRLIEKIQTFDIKSVTVGGNDLRNYVFDYPTAIRLDAQEVQRLLYEGTGIWLPKGSGTKNQKAIIIREIELDGKGSTPNGFRVYVDGDENLIIETEFVNRIDKGMNLFFNEVILAGGKTDVKIPNNYVWAEYDARNIYYSEFGATGDGTTDDFEAIKACHAYANNHGHTVHADPGAVYYIGKNDKGTSAIIQTNTFWHGCKFIFDDREIQQPLTAEQNGGVEVKADPGYSAPIFKVTPDRPPETLTDSSVPFTTLKKGATHVGYAPGCNVLLVVYNDNVKHFIRYGANADNGQSQHEIILVDKDGNIDSSTPVQWDYEVVTKVIVNFIDDKPITISGGTYDIEAGIDNRAYIEQKHNTGRAFYTYYHRNINISRSNLVIKNIRHEYTEFTKNSQGGRAAPYTGFTTVKRCNNVLVQGFEFMCPEQYTKEDDAKVGMGSYDISATEANALTYKDSTQSNFYEPDGNVIFHGLMGTNFCKNLTFDNMFVCSFDAHCGVYNATIKNSTIEHLNFIGAGEAVIENCVIYTGGLAAAMTLRGDYGSTWDGNLTVKNVEFRYKSLSSTKKITLIRAEWYNHNFGYTVHYPENVYIEDVTTVKYNCGVTNGERWETLVESTRNTAEVQLIYREGSANPGNHSYDLSDPNVKIYGAINKNPVVPIKTVVINNVKYKTNPVNIVLPTSPTFNGMSVTKDGIKIK